MDDGDVEFGLVRIKREWCPEWLWYFACNPIPFWNEYVSNRLLLGSGRIYLAPLTWLLARDVTDADRERLSSGAEG